MTVRHSLALSGLVVCFARCSCSDITIAPPRVPEGGRALAIAVSSNNVQRLFVTTETGGLYRTYNGGTSWQHLGGLPNHRTFDVAVASLAPDVVIATTRAAFRTINDGGIWRSSDGGGTWKQATGWVPPPGPNCKSRPSAYGISHMPLTRTFFVATDCGIAVSSDNGGSWTHFLLDSAATPAVDSSQHRVRSLLVVNRTTGVAAADRGIFHLDSTARWSRSTISSTSGRVPVLHAFATPWWTGKASLWFHASGQDQKIFASTDGGATWSPVPSPSVENREAFVRMGRAASGDQDQVDVYIGDGQNLHRQTFSISTFSPAGTWNKLGTDHLDPSDIAFDLIQQAPILLASDGGVHRTGDGGAHWTLTGGGFGGFNALQINEVTGQTVTGSKPHLDLYYSTQDNSIRASPDGGQTWPGVAGGEGRHIRTVPTSVDHQGTRVTGGRQDEPHNYVSEPHFANVKAWPSAPVGVETDGSAAPGLIVEDVYLQPSVDSSVTPFTTNYFLTQSAGAQWTHVFALQLTPSGPTTFAGSPANPTAYQGVIRPGDFQGGRRYGLMRASNITTTAMVFRADSLGMGTMGSLRTPIARYVAFGADPRNADHLLASDIQSGDMKFSADAGVTWFALPALTQAVTDSGKFLFNVSDQSLASVIAWDPYDVCTILVGTIQNGVIRSSDGGRTWKKITGTEVATHISSFFFPPTGAIWVSTNGRGLWNLKLSRRQNADPKGCPFPDPPPGGLPGDTLIVLDPVAGAAARPFTGLGDPAVCERCSLVGVRNGWITGWEATGDSLRQVALSSGAIFHIDRTGTERPLFMPNVYRDGDGRPRERNMTRTVIGDRRVRALIVEGARLRGVVAARDELPFGPSRTPAMFVYALRGARKTLEVSAGDSVRVTGSGFLPASASAQPVELSLDGEVVAPRVIVRADGSFSAAVRVARPVGESVLTARQVDGRRVTIETATIDVRARDGS